MNTEHPITPPDELVQQWREKWKKEIKDNAITPGIQVGDYIATQAANWGADQELEACVEWLAQNCGLWELSSTLRDARRPKPPSLAEEALEQFQAMEQAGALDCNIDAIRAALERLKELEKGNE